MVWQPPLFLGDVLNDALLCASSTNTTGCYAQKRLVLPEFHTIKRITLLGLPVGLALFFEVTLFAVVALLVSPLGVTAVASHQIALNFSSLMFMFLFPWE